LDHGTRCCGLVCSLSCACVGSWTK
jgi:hypothetical protein